MSNRENICLQTLFLLFKCSNRETKEFFVSPANTFLVGILITIGDVTDIVSFRNINIRPDSASEKTYMKFSFDSSKVTNATSDGFYCQRNFASSDFH